jgi:tetratricopeptide (TPR) repeat protein
MRCALLLLAVMLAVPAQTVRYELRGRLKPGVRASVWLHGAITPFDDGTLSDDEGRFRFRDLPAGAYTLGAFVPGRGEMRRTIEVGPSLADAKGRIDLVVDLESAPFESHDSLRRGAVVSARELAIPERANREYVEAAKSLNRRDVEGAVAHLKRAVEIAPQFAAAWNYLGTIAYQTHDFKGAETYFRRGLEADPQAYEPLVNLGGVLVNLQKFDEALQYNRHAVLTRPNDALANAQLGMTYFYLGNAELSRKYLTAATRIDPGHFSHPQLMLAEIDIRQGDRAAAARELEEFLKYHPDWPEAAKLKEHIARLRQPAALSAQAAAPAADPAQAYAATGMARSFSTSPDLPLVDDFADAPSGRHYRVLRKEGRYYLQSLDASGRTVEASVDGVLGSGRHARVLLSHAGDGRWIELPLTWFTESGGHWGASPGFASLPPPDFGRAVPAGCLSCHTMQTADRLGPIGCGRCHSAGKPSQAVCLQCHVPNRVPDSGHGQGPAGDDRLDLNSAAYRLFRSRCYRAAGDKLTCMTCHPPHTFSKTLAEYRQVCRGCHPTMHNSAALNCTRCHMPKRRAEDAVGTMVTDHRIQRPL